MAKFTVTSSVDAWGEVEAEIHFNDGRSSQSFRLSKDGTPAMALEIFQQFGPSEYFGLYDDAKNAVQDILLNLDDATVDAARECLGDLLDYPANTRLASLPRWYPLWAESWVKLDVAEAVRTMNANELWSYLTSGKDLQIDMDYITADLMARIGAEQPQLFAPVPEDAEVEA